MLSRRLLVMALTLPLGLAGCTSQVQGAAQGPAHEPQVILRVSGSGTGLPPVGKIAEAYQKQNPQVQVRISGGTNTGGAIRGVMEGTLELAVSNRPLNDKEAKEPIVYNAFARDPLVFAARLPNVVKNITTEQVRDVYSGKVANWKYLGGSDAPIVVLDRDPDESARTLGLIPLMDGRPVDPKAVVLSKASEMVEALESTPDSLGYTSVGLQNILGARNVQVLSLNGVAPSAETLKAGAYPLLFTFALVHREDARDAVRSFVKFAQGPEGQRALEVYGYSSVGQ